MKRRHALYALVLCTLMVAGCQTTGEEKPVVMVPAVPEPSLFTPVAMERPIQFEAGRYPSLFSGVSMAQWVENGANGSSDAAAALSNQFLVLECTLESMFADRSIAYDAVGLRGIQAYLMGPSGVRYSPTQSMIGRDLVERSQGALKIYGRTIILAFPKEATVVSGAPTDTATLRLYLEGHGSTFYFEWQPRPEFVTQKRARWEKTKDVVQDGTETTLDKAKAISHRFD